MLVKLKMTKEIWDEAHRNIHRGLFRSHCCPLSIAFRNATGLAYGQVKTGMDQFFFFPYEEEIPLPDEAEVYRSAFDNFHLYPGDATITVHVPKRLINRLLKEQNNAS